MSLDVTVSGDTLCEYILDCLVEIAVIYGPAFITMQYIPYCADLVDQAIRRLTSPLESAIISAMMLLKVSCDCLSDKQIMDHLQVRQKKHATNSQKWIQGDPRGSLQYILKNPNFVLNGSVVVLSPLEQTVTGSIGYKNCTMLFDTY
jgi:hypothetical protein